MRKVEADPQRARTAQERPAVVVRLLGGLGNQMFQYAAARAVAHHSGAQVLLDLRAFESYNLRKPELHRWRIEASEASNRDLRPYPAGALRLSGRFRRLGALTRCYFEPSLAFHGVLFSRKAPLHLNGYFQSEKYFSQIRPLLLKEFMPARPMSVENRRISEEAAATNSVSMHMRRGDYLSDARNLAVHGACDAGYYKRAIDTLLSTTGNATYFLFSDDMDWVRRNITVPGRAIYVEGNQADPEMDIHLMSVCRHNICANSSFSWWGAWLNSNENKTVIAPVRWFATDRHDAADLVPPQWIRLG